ncbi:MAG: alpha/beta hydrolase [Bacteroidia bacterium]|nr:alpha/beta hydrolase [Bacteroidia bacterium]MCZ2141511.1 alpha/beta hydrolase [Bacteroidia bacterium]
MIHYDRFGEGDVLVLIHGFCENNTCFDKQVLLLKEHCKIILPDLPGAGKSSTIENTTLESYADSMAELLMALEIKDTTVIGHSMGGYVTLALAKKYPHLIKRFGLLHSTAKADDDTRKSKRNQAIKLIDEKGAKFYATNFIPPLFNPATPIEVAKPYIKIGETFPASGLKNALAAMRDREDSTKFISEVDKPIFWGIGEFDALIPSDVMLQQALICKQSYIAHFKHSGHMSHIEEPELLAKQILQFMECKIL